MTDDRDKPTARRRAKSTPLLVRIARTDVFYRVSANLLRGAMSVIRRMGRERALRVGLRFFRLIAPLTAENRMAQRSIAAAFPEKGETERAAILRGAWENFARVIVDFVFLEELATGFDPANPTAGAITISGNAYFESLRDDGKPAVIIAAHLANWEILGVVSHRFGLKTVLPFRGPANFHLAEDVLAKREALMGRLVDSHRGASFEIAAALDRGEHLGMLIDQRLNNGIVVPFFGRPALTNPLPAKFARQYDCPVHAARAIRLPDGRLHLELTPPIDLPRDSDGLIDVAAATAVFNRIVEGWVREHPEQWFWLHDRWRIKRSRKSAAGRARQ